MQAGLQSPATVAPATRRSWRPRFSTRSLFITVTLFAVLAAWIGAAIREGIRHQQIADRIDSAGGWASWSHHQWVDTGNRSSRLQSTLPTWVDSLHLDTSVRRIQGVLLRGSRSSDFNAQLAALAELGRVEHIRIDGAGFGPPEFQRLMATVEMETIAASSPRAVSALQLPRGRLPALKKASLRSLDLDRTQFSDEAIGDLPDSIEFLNLTRTRVSDGGLMKFARLKKLTQLNLSRTPTSLAAVEDLRKAMPGCKIKWEPLDYRWHRHATYRRWHRRDSRGELRYHDLWGSDFETIDYQGAVGQVDRVTVYHNESGNAAQERQRIAEMFDHNGWMSIDLAQQPTLFVECAIVRSKSPVEIDKRQKFAEWLNTLLGSTGLGDCAADGMADSTKIRCRVVDVPIARQVIGQELAKSAFAGYAKLID